MGFCRRCGEIVVGPKCKCGGSAVAPVVKWNHGNAREPTLDKWSKTYTARDKSPDRRPTVSTSTMEHTCTAATNPPTSPTKRFPRPMSTSTNTSSTFSNGIPLGKRVSAHIASHTDNLQPPLKHSAAPNYAPEAGVLPTPNSTSLSKVHGSVLQPKESLTMHSCTKCSTAFLPDATIYPDPSSLNTSLSTQDTTSPSFLCLPCFTVHGGSKGDCSTCHRPVLGLKSEGFVQATGKVWHKRCFKCEGCFKDIGESPMVDLMGKPSCVECFDGCLKRDPGSPSPSRKYEIPKTKSANIGGMRDGKARSREGSPAIDELEMRLGIVKSREGTPARDREEASISTTRSPLAKSTSKSDISPLTPKETSPLGEGKRSVGSPSPVRYEKFKNAKLGSPKFGSPASSSRLNEYISPRSTEIEEMKFNVLKSSSPSPLTPRRTTQLSPIAASPSPSASAKTLTTTPISSAACRSTQLSPIEASPPSPVTKEARSNSACRIPVTVGTPPFGSKTGSNSPRAYSENDDEIPMTPDLVSDASDTLSITSSSELDSPPSSIGEDVFGGWMHEEDKTPTKKKLRLNLSIQHPSPASNSSCVRCRRPLLPREDEEKWVTVLNGDEGETEQYHAECFKCATCSGEFKGVENGQEGQAVFVRREEGISHVDCAKRGGNGRKDLQTCRSTAAEAVAHPLREYDQPLLTAPPSTTVFPTSTSVPRFGSSNACPGCRRNVSPMERGVVPGPQGTRWHTACLVCGGKERAKGGAKPGCGKKLDSAAKGDGDGGVWCRECLLLLPMGMRGSPKGSPTRSPIILTFPSSAKGFRNSVTPQYTGTTTIARQFTGLGTMDGGLMRQLTGGGLSPTRQLGRESPTKHFGRDSPTKQLTSVSESGTDGPTKQLVTGARGGWPKPRPKSVIGMRGKSVDEGRGMFLVRQMTGNGWE